jgi:MGT family glycosyltransferase
MSRILVYTSPARGHLFPIMALVLELKARGHDVAVRTHAVDVELVRAQGVRAAAVDPRVEAVAGDDWQSRNSREGLKASVRTFTSRAPYDGPDLRAAIELEHPDAVIVDVNAWGAMTEAEAWGGPWAAFFPYPMPLDSVDTPPFGPGLPPARTILGRGRDRLLRPVLVGTLEKLMRPGMNELRTTRGLAPLASVNDLFGAPPLTLYTTAEPFEYHRRDLPANVVMVGPLEWEPPVHPPAWLDEVDGPLVLVTTSTEYQEDTRLVRTALEALADEPVHVVATLPSDDPASVDVPANAHVEAFVPHRLVLERAVCAITHGGMGGTQKALARGVPVVAVPFGRDQAEVARRVDVAGAGVRLPARRLRPDRLRDAVRQARSRTAGAERVAAGFRRAGGAAAAADALETRLLQGARTPLARDH